MIAKKNIKELVSKSIELREYLSNKGYFEEGVVTINRCLDILEENNNIKEDNSRQLAEAHS